MKDREFTFAMCIIHSIELLKYIEIIDELYPLDQKDKRTKAAALEFQYSKNRIKQFKNLLSPSCVEDKEAIDSISSCYSDLSRKLLDATPEDRERMLLQISEFLDSL